jgi:hypothetical protein
MDWAESPGAPLQEEKMLAATFGVGQVAYSLLWLALLFIEIWLVIMVFADIFSSRDMSGWAKALWIILVFLFPLVGVLAYLIVRGPKMRAHQIVALEQQEQALRRYIKEVVGDTYGSRADEIAKLARLYENGTISAAEFEALKAEVMGMMATGRPRTSA